MATETTEQPFDTIRSMIAVYVDQNHFVNLARAYHGRRDGAPHADALGALSEAVRLRIARVPLSAIHYVETYNRDEHNSRHRLARTMAEISEFWAIAPVTALVEYEIECAVHETYRVGSAPRRISIFGRGLEHAFDLGGPLSPLLDSPWRTRGSMWWDIQQALLAGPPAGIAAAGLGVSYRDVPTRHAAVQQELQRAVDNGEVLAADLAWAIAYINHRPLMERIFGEYGISFDDLLEAGRLAMAGFLRSIPTAYVDAKLRAWWYGLNGAIWRRGDMNDVGALAVAIPYCDIVLCDKFWARGVHETGLDVAFDTKVLDSLADLPTAMVELSAA